jgi:hypothetical protein
LYACQYKFTEVIFIISNFTLCFALPFAAAQSINTAKPQQKYRAKHNVILIIINITYINS